MNQSQDQKQQTIGELPKCKILIVGNSSVGKSCIMSKYITGDFFNKQVSTVGHDYQLKDVIINNVTVKLQIWDTAGQEKYRPMIKSYFKAAKGAFLVFDLTDKKSFEDMKYWVKELERGIDCKYAKILLGNKYDLYEENENNEYFVNKADVEVFVKENSLTYFQTSAKTGLNIDQSFQTVAKQILEYYKNDVVSGQQDKPKGIVLGDKKKEQKKSGCC